MNSRFTRKTQQRESILAVLDQATGFLSAAQVHAALVSTGHRAGLTTIYRTLQILVEAGELEAMIPAKATVFRRSRRQVDRQQPHLVCRDCGETVVISDDSTVKQWIEEIRQRYGFEPGSEPINIVGRCPRCEKNGDPFSVNHRSNEP